MTSQTLPRPSSLPMLLQCPCFESQGSDDADSGTARHEYLAALWRVDKGGNSFDDIADAEAIAKAMSEQDREGVHWAYDYIKLKAPLLDYPMNFEQRLTMYDDDFRPIWSGTPDAVCGPHVFDMKWRERDYVPQMAGYACLIFDDSEFDQLTFHVLYACNQRAHVFTLTPESAADIVRPIDERYFDQNKQPTTCEYCGWCSRRLNCPAFNAPAIAVAAGREDWAMQTYHISEITSPDDMAKAILLATHLRKWCDAVDWHKREWAIKQGIKIPGFKVRVDKGNREIEDLNQALALSGLPPEEFIKACAISIGALKKVWATHFVMGEKAADKEIDKKLAAVITREPVEKVVKEKEPTNGNSD